MVSFEANIAEGRKEFSGDFSALCSTEPLLKLQGKEV